MDSHSDVNDDIIIHKKTYKVPVIMNEQTESATGKKSNITRIIIIICIGLLIVSVAINLVLLSRNNSNDSGLDRNGDEEGQEEKTSSNVKVETLWEPDPDSDDPEADYEAWLEEKKDSAESQEESIIAELDIIGNMIVKQEYTEALTRLDAISREGLSNDLLFRLYNVYSRVYQENGDTDKYNEYVELRTEQLRYLYGEE